MMRLLRAWTRCPGQAPLALNSIPAMSLLNNPYLRDLRHDPRLAEIDERIRSAVNVERKKVGLGPSTAMPGSATRDTFDEELTLYPRRL